MRRNNGLKVLVAILLLLGVTVVFARCGSKRPSGVYRWFGEEGTGNDGIMMTITFDDYHYELQRGKLLPNGIEWADFFWSTTGTFTIDGSKIIFGEDGVIYHPVKDYGAAYGRYDSKEEMILLFFSDGSGALLEKQR